MGRVLSLIRLMLIVWASLIVGFLMLLKYVVEITFPISGPVGGLITGATKVALGALMAIVWLYAWKRLAQAYFWRNVKKR